MWDNQCMQSHTQVIQLLAFVIPRRSVRTLTPTHVHAHFRTCAHTHSFMRAHSHMHTYQQEKDQSPIFVTLCEVSGRLSQLWKTFSWWASHKYHLKWRSKMLILCHSCIQTWEGEIWSIQLLRLALIDTDYLSDSIDQLVSDVLHLLPPM